MNPTAIRHAWEEAFPDAPPQGAFCRPAVADRWLRTHSLPGSKRYADTDDERAEILRRYNAVASDILGNESPCFLFVARLGDERQWKPCDGLAPSGEFALVHVISHEEDEDKFQFFATPLTWRAGAFDALLTAVADDHALPLLFFSPARRTAFAPYDGGADLFLKSNEAVRERRERFADWLSPNANGM